MSVVINTKVETRWGLLPLPIVRFPKAKFPIYLYVEVLALIIVALVLVNWTLVVRQDVPLSDPFLAYTDNWLEPDLDTHSSPELTCSVVSVDDHKYCTFSPSSGPIRYVMGISTNGVIRWNGFTIRKNTLTLGDLALLWGKPVSHIYQQSALFEWPDLGISANGWTESRQFDYHIPILRVVIHRDVSLASRPLPPNKS